MRLLRLLTAGRSLEGLQDSAGRYHATDQRLLPKFGSDKNPFRATTLPEPAPAAASASALAQGRGGFGEPALPSQSQAPQPSVPASASKPARRPWFGQCASKLAALLAPAPKAAKPAKAAVPRPAKAPVQGELSLDAIKVVRNDLSDSDLEVIPAQGPVAPARPAPAPAPAESAEPVGATWSRVSTRLFGANKTLT